MLVAVATDAERRKVAGVMVPEGLKALLRQARAVMRVVQAPTIKPDTPIRDLAD
jgi:hypothetical protein